MSAPASIKSKKRILILFIMFGVVLVALGARLGWIMLVDGDEYSKKAASQQIKDTSIKAERGTIYDVNMNELAVNAPTYSVWAWPETIKKSEKNVNTMAKKLAAITKGDVKTIAAELQDDSSMIRIAKNLDSDQAEKIQKLLKNEELVGLSIDESTKRYYPYGDFCSNTIGHTNDDGNGICGLELYYNSYLSGTAGRLIQNTDVNGRVLSYGNEKYYEPEDGLDIVLTIDSVLQQYLENQLKRAYEEMDPKQTIGISINPHTGEILAMGIYPGYDLNNPKQPVTEKQQEEYDALTTSQEKLEYWNSMWRNFMVSDTYEPGSTFKLITTAIALEEGLTSMDETFCCTGYFKVGIDTLRCWRYYAPHGTETLPEAVQHSCNPVFCTLALRIGATKYFEYLDALGFSDGTGIDLPSETSAIMYSHDTIVPTELCTTSYGQGISVTPIELISAISAVVNGGNYVIPHVVKQIQDDDENIIYKADTKTVRKVFSEQTSKEMCEIMQSVVEQGTGSAAYIPGYRVGGKTGTADKVINGRYADGKVFSSFVAVAPADDPEVVTLIIVDEPAGEVHYASTVVVPYVKSFLEEALPYLEVEPIYADSQRVSTDAAGPAVPSVTGMTVEKAKAALAARGLKAIVMPETVTDMSVKVKDQYPKASTRVKEGSSVYLYTQ